MMTPLQHHFPFFCDVAKLNHDLRIYGLRAFLSRDEGSDREEMLVIAKDGQRLTIGFGEFIMVGEGILFCWKKFQEGLEIRQFDLTAGEFPGNAQEEFIDILKHDPGNHPNATKLAYMHFVTFIRKNNLVRAEDFHEQYVIVMLHEHTLRIIPFDTFNETGGDPMYVWPALAAYDPVTGKLHGTGMRMAPFTIQLEK